MISIKAGLAIAFALVEITSCLEIAQAQLSPNIQVVSDNQQPILGPDSLATGRDPKVPRGPCEAADIAYTPLLPVTESGFSGFTLTGYPTFWFYVRHNTNDISFGKFSIEDEQKNQVYETYLKLPKTPGFVSISIPTTTKPLEKNKQHHWTFTRYCISNYQSDDAPKAWHEGTIQRLDMPALETQLKTATLEERSKLYIENRIWYDAPGDLPKSKNFAQDWRNLLRAIGLEQLAQEPIAGEVVPIEEGN